jgi:hypothetical protein
MYQPRTIDPKNLLIGISAIEINGIDLGAITTASIEITTTIKERYVGYPAQRMESVTDSVVAIASITAEEIGSSIIISMLNNIQDVYTVNMYAPFAVDDKSLTLGASVKMLPELNINWQDDWCSIGFKFECIGDNAQTIVTRNITPIKRPAVTNNKFNLAIGKPKVLVNDISIGAIQGASIALSGTVKKLEKGYPRCTANIIHLESKFDIAITAEEQILSGADCNIKIQQQLVDGNALQFEFPHCSIPEDLGIAPSNNWLGYKQKIMPFGTEYTICRV